MKSGDARSAAVAGVLGRAAPTSRATRGRSEFVIRALKDVGWTGFSVNDALTPLSNMGQILYEPPDVSRLGRRARRWFSTGAMLARMNFASSLAANQKFNLATAVKAANASKTPEALLSYFVDALVTAPLDRSVTGGAGRTTCTRPARGPAATRSCRPSRSGLVHLIAGSPEYQLV